MSKIYHYTSVQAIPNIKEKGLLNISGLIFFTTSDENEPTVNFAPLRQQGRVVVELDDSFEKVTERLEDDYDLMASYFNPELIGLISDISLWYISEKESIKPEHILSFEIEEDGVWIPYEE